MKDSLKYKFLAFVCILFVAGLSLSTGFLLGANRTEGNTAFWVFKIIAVAYLVVLAGMVFFKNSTFSKLAPVAEAGLILQVVPILCRIGWTGEEPKVPILIIYLCAIVTFVIIAVAAFLLIANKKFKQDEDRAIPSSNTPGVQNTPDNQNTNETN